MLQQQTALDEQTQRDKCKKPNKRKSNKKVLQIQLPDKAQPQSSQPELQPRERKQVDTLISQTSTTNCEKPQLREVTDKRTITHSIAAATTHTSSSDNSTASCDSDSEEAVSDKLASMCHHCLRPQIELQLRHLRPHQRRQWSRLLQQQCSKRRTSKTRKEVSWSGAHGENGSGRRDGHGGGDGGNAGAITAGWQRYDASDYMLPTNTYTSGVHWSRRDVSAAVRYRCPQVGPKSAPYHFHHPQQLHNAYQLQLLLQQCDYVPPSYYQHQQQQQQQPYYERHAAQHNSKMDYSNTTTAAASTTTTATTATTINIECESHMQLQKQQDRNVRLQQNQNLYATTTNILTATSSGCSDACCTSNASSVAASALTAPAGTTVALQPQSTTTHPLDRATRGTVSDSELQLQQHLPTSESPSLVKVRAWYTVAKQGVSC